VVLALLSERKLITLTFWWGNPSKAEGQSGSILGISRHQGTTLACRSLLMY
jgi:hypothetical protein